MGSLFALISLRSSARDRRQLSETVDNRHEVLTISTGRQLNGDRLRA
jgi:hypothetical protein